MEWVAEGLTLIFIGGLVMVITLAKGTNDGAAIIVYRASAIMLIIMAAWSSLGDLTPRQFIDKYKTSIRSQKTPVLVGSVFGCGSQWLEKLNQEVVH